MRHQSWVCFNGSQAKAANRASTAIMPEQVGGEVVLWRRIQPNKLHNEGGFYRPQSAAFMPDSDGEICVHIADLTTKERILAAYPHDGIVEFPAGLPLSL